MRGGADSRPAMAVRFLSESQNASSMGAHAPVSGDGFPDCPRLSGSSWKQAKNDAIFPPAHPLVGPGGLENPKSLEGFDRGPASPGPEGGSQIPVFPVLAFLASPPKSVIAPGDSPHYGRRNL